MIDLYWCNRCYFRSSSTICIELLSKQLRTPLPNRPFNLLICCTTFLYSVNIHFQYETVYTYQYFRFSLRFIKKTNSSKPYTRQEKKKWEKERNKNPLSTDELIHHVVISRKTSGVSYFLCVYFDSWGQSNRLEYRRLVSGYFLPVGCTQIMKIIYCKEDTGILHI